MSEPYERVPNQHYEITYDQAIEICDLISRIDRDDSAYNAIFDLATSIAHPRQRNKLTRDQIAPLVAKLNSLADTKFPNPRYITHLGYRICLKALVERITKPSPSGWDRLAAEAKMLPNASDRVFVLSTIATACMSRERTKSRQILEEAATIANGLPSAYDRVARINMVAKQAWEVDAALGKQLLESCMRTTLTEIGDDLWPLQRDMLDFAHQVDPDLAASLVALADSDAARATTRHSMQEHLNMLKSTKSLADQPTGKAREQIKTEHYPMAAWRLLGQLNAGRAEHRRVEDMREYVVIASGLPFSEAYPILALVIGNAVKRFADTDQAVTILRPMFEATLLASQIAGRMADQNTRVVRDALVGGGHPARGDSGDLIKAGQRDLAVRRIRQWIEERVTDCLTISDPFFGPDDLEVLKLVLEIKPKIKVSILTSIKHQKQESVVEPYQSTYMQHWRSSISAQDPPDTDVAIVGTKTLDSPIHDRWWLTAGSGLRMGTSYRSIGVEKEAELSVLPAEMAAEFEERVNRFFRREVREHKGEKLSCTIFTLD